MKLSIAEHLDQTISICSLKDISLGLSGSICHFQRFLAKLKTYFIHISFYKVHSKWVAKFRLEMAEKEVTGQVPPKLLEAGGLQL